MEKIEKTNHCIYKSRVTFYLDDIKKVIKLMELYSFQVFISDNNYTYDGLDDLIKSKQDSVKELKIVARKNYDSIQVNMSNFGYELYKGDFTNEESKALESRIISELNGGWGGFKFLFPGMLFFIPILTILGFAFVIQFMTHFFPYFDLDYQTIGRLLTRLVIIICCLDYLFRGIGNKVKLYDKESQTSFFVRNKDALMLTLLGAVIGAIAYKIVDKIFS